LGKSLFYGIGGYDVFLTMEDMGKWGFLLEVWIEVGTGVELDGGDIEILGKTVDGMWVKVGDVMDFGIFFELKFETKIGTDGGSFIFNKFKCG
jgi:hypothetical protein